MTAAPRPRALLLTLYGAYLREFGGWAAVADIITLMEDVEVSAQSTRSAISRMKQTGLLEAERRNNIAGYSLTTEALAMLSEGDELIYDTIEPTDDEWAMVVFSIPEAERARRHELRSRLARLGFGQLTSGVWIAPHAAARRATPMLATTGLDRYVTVWTARPEESSTIDRWMTDAWHLEDLAGVYREFIAGHQAVIDDPMDDRAAFAAYLRLLSDWRRLPFMDPGLPQEFLPTPWPGPEARALFTRGRDRLEARGRRHVMATIQLTPVRQAP